jgi:hypothetical protein
VHCYTRKFDGGAVYVEARVVSLDDGPHAWLPTAMYACVACPGQDLPKMSSWRSPRYRGTPTAGEGDQRPVCHCLRTMTY